MPGSTTTPPSASPEASSKTTKVSYELSTDDMEEIELRISREVSGELSAERIAFYKQPKPSPTD